MVGLMTSVSNTVRIILAFLMQLKPWSSNCCGLSRWCPEAKFIVAKISRKLGYLKRNIRCYVIMKFCRSAERGWSIHEINFSSRSHNGFETIPRYCLAADQQQNIDASRVSND